VTIFSAVDVCYFYLKLNPYAAVLFDDISVSLPRGYFQGIKCTMKLTTHGLFLTCTKKFYLNIYITQNQ
jgi:hypothetical protein